MIEHLRTTASVCTQKYLQNSCQTSKMEVLTKIMDGWKSLSIFGKTFITMSINQSVSANDYWPWNWTEYGGFPSHTQLKLNGVVLYFILLPKWYRGFKIPLQLHVPDFFSFCFCFVIFFFHSRVEYSNTYNIYSFKVNKKAL